MVRQARKKNAANSSDEDQSDASSSSPSTRPPKRKVAKKDTKQTSKKETTKKETRTINDAAPPSPTHSDSDEENPLAEDYDDNNLLSIKVPPPPVPCMSRDGTGKRLMIKHIIVENFKSYYGVRKLGPFHKNFTAIIGPNGSGKSNVIDAMLFVFGYKAKKIRSKKLSVLIHSSAGKDNINSCRVTVAFQSIVDKGPHDFDVVPNSEFTVTRVAYKNNNSDYMYNDKKMSFKEIAKRLREVGIDLIHNRFLILQGEVEQIAMMKAKAAVPGEEGMLEYLEDIIGSSRFKEPISRLSAKLEQLQLDKSHQNTKVNAAMKEKQAMEGPVAEMVEFLRIENGITKFKNKLLHAEKFKHLTEVEEKEPARNRLKEEAKKSSDELKEVKAEMTEKKKEFQTLEAKQQKLEDDIQAIDEQIGMILQKEQKRMTDNKRISNEITKLTKEITKLQKELEDIDNVPANAEKAIELFESKLEDMKEEEQRAKGLIEQNMARYVKKTEKEREKKAVVEEEYGEKMEKKTELEGQLSIAESKLKNLEEGRTEAQKRVTDLENEIQEQREKIEKNTQEQKRLKGEVTRMEQERSDLGAELEKLRENEDGLSAEINALRRTADSIAGGMNNTQQLTASLRALNQAKRNGQIPGFFGRLGDLGSIDPKYDIAVSTNGSMDLYVVDTVETSSECIKILKEARAGTASFVALDKQHFNMAPKKFPLKRLFDLIKVDDKRVLPAFYFSLRDTLIADNLDIAADIHKQGHYRISTLKGELIEMNGAVIGGGRPAEGKIGKGNVRPSGKSDDELKKELEETRNQIRDKEQELNRIRQTVKEKERRKFEIGPMIRDGSEAIERITRELKTSNEMLPVREGQLKTAKQELAKNVVDEKEVQKIKKEIDKYKKERDQLLAVTTECEQRIKVIDDKISYVHRDLIAIHEEALKRVTEKIKETNALIIEEHRKKADAPRQRNKLARQIETKEQDMDKKRGKNSDLVNMQDLFQKSRAEYESKKADYEEEKARIQKEVENARNSNTGLDNREIELQTLLDKINKELCVVEHRLKDSKEKLATVEKQIGALKLHKMSDLKKDLPHLPWNGTDYIVGMESDSEDEEEEQAPENDQPARTNSEGEEQDEPMDSQSNDGEEPPPPPQKEKRKKRSEEQVPEYTREQIEGMDMEEISVRKAGLEKMREQKRGKLDPHIIADYRAKAQRVREEAEVLNAITQNYVQHRDFCENLQKERLGEFMDGFESISISLRELYQLITLGGDASLELKDLIDPFIEGIQFMVRPPKKSWKHIENLSGGEKTLSSLALVFALHRYRPTPLYVMDEIDAALDFRNVSIIGHYIKDKTQNAQFIIISLRNNMFELADRLIGIYKVHDCTRNVVIDPNAVLASTANLRQGVDKLKALAANSSAISTMIRDGNASMISARKTTTSKKRGVRTKSGNVDTIHEEEEEEDENDIDVV